MSPRTSISIEQSTSSIVILIVEDNKADIRLIREVLNRGNIIVDLQAVYDGEQCMSYLRKERGYSQAKTPDIILLDLNMPKKSGHEVLADIKTDNKLKTIPVIVMTVSKSEEDILKSYELYANAYIVKPVEYYQLEETIRSLEDFWFQAIKLPPKFYS